MSHRNYLRSPLIRAWTALTEEPWHVVIVLTILATTVLMVIAAVGTARAKAECRDAGGSVVEYNCQTYFVDYDGVLVPQERCDWRCALPAERP